jgi:hypothetical protein
LPLVPRATRVALFRAMPLALPATDRCGTLAGVKRNFCSSALSLP